MHQLDNRGLPPPEPMVRILTALETLSPGETLLALGDREPLFLFPELAARGFAWEMQRQADGSVQITIRHTA